MRRLLLGLIFSLIMISQGAFANAGLLFNVATSGLNLAITTTTGNRVYPTVGIKLNTPGYFLAASGIQCKPAANGYCIFSANGTTPTIISTVSVTSEPLSITLCLNGNGPLSCQNYSPSTQVGYITSGNNNLVVSCSLPSSGGLGTCTGYDGNGLRKIGAFDFPSAIAINNSKTLAYVANYISTSLAICPLSITGAIQGCVINNDPAFNFNYGGLAINKANTALYSTNYGSNNVYLCPIDSIGALDTCVDSGAGAIFNEPFGIALNSANTQAYVVNYGNSTVAVCSVNSNGSLFNCTDAGGTFDAPLEIAINQSGTHAYVTNEGDNTLSNCTIAADGHFSSCVTASTTFNQPWPVALSRDGTKLYIGNYGSSVMTICSLLSNGSIGTCSNDTDPALSGPSNMFVV